MKLAQKQIDFEMIDDTDEIVELGNRIGIRTAPILKVDDQYLDFPAAVKWVNER